MALLSTFPNETQKTQDVQNQQTYIALQAIQNWSGLILTQSDIDYKQSSDANLNVQASNATTNSGSWVAIPNFSFNFTPKNTLCLININLAIQGNGWLGIIVNGSVIDAIPFNFSTITQFPFMAFEKLSVSSNKINLVWKASSGQIKLSCGIGSSFYNRVQIIDINS